MFGLYSGSLSSTDILRTHYPPEPVYIISTPTTPPTTAQDLICAKSDTLGMLNLVIQTVLTVAATVQ